MNYIFDFDGTLADSKLCSILATQAVFRERKLEVPSEEQIEYYMGIPIEQSFHDMAKETLDGNEFDELLISFRKYYKEYENTTLQLFPNMKEILEKLKESKADCFVVSSKKTEVLKRNLTTLGIDLYFKDCIGSDQVKHYKPHPDGILTILERYHLEASSCIMIGDATFDIQMGKAANCKTCAVVWGSHTREMLEKENPDFVIDEVLQLLVI